MTACLARCRAPGAELVAPGVLELRRRPDRGAFPFELWFLPDSAGLRDLPCAVAETEAEGRAHFTWARALAEAEDR